MHIVVLLNQPVETIPVASPNPSLKFSLTMFDLTRYASGARNVSGFHPAENPEKRMRRLLALSLLLVLGSSTVLIGAASFMKTKETTNPPPTVSVQTGSVSKDVRLSCWISVDLE